MTATATAPVIELDNLLTCGWQPTQTREVTFPNEKNCLQALITHSSHLTPTKYSHLTGANEEVSFLWQSPTRRQRQPQDWPYPMSVDFDTSSTMPLVDETQVYEELIRNYIKETRTNHIMGDLSQDVTAFLKTHSLTNDFARFLDTASHSFKRLGQATARVQTDPEELDQWVAVDITVQGDVDSILEQYNLFTDMVVSDLSPAANALLQISLNIVEE